jgi:hypothetical protein
VKVFCQELSQLKERGHRQVLPFQVYIQVTPGHQVKLIAAPYMRRAIAQKNRLQVFVQQKFIRLFSNL